MSVYTLPEQLRKGQIGERILDSYISRLYHLVPASKIQQNCGIDRIVYFEKDGRPFYLEYKTDFKAHNTGNAFIETVGSSTRRGNGWATKSKADILLYYLPQSGRIYITVMTRLRDRLDDWKRQYQPAAADNRTYKTHGLLVPLPELAKISEVANIPPRQL